MASAVSINQKQYSIPTSLYELEFQEGDEIETLVVSKEAILEKIDSSALWGLKIIQLQNGEIISAENEDIAAFLVKQNKYIVITRDKEGEYLYKFISKDNLSVMQEGKMLAGNPYVIEKPIYQYDYIEDIDLTHIDDDMLLYIGIVGPKESQRRMGMKQAESLMLYDDSNEIYKGKI